MNILHCCLASFYIDNYGYQENILPKEHKKMGHTVKIIASTETFIDNNKIGYLKPSRYRTEDGIEVVRLAYSRALPHFVMKKIRLYSKLNREIEEFKPDILFLHGPQFLSILQIISYVEKNVNTKVFVDSHADFSNSARSWFSKYVMHGIIYRFCAKKIEPFANKFWGVLPARVSFLVKMYKIREEKIGLLVMGAEDEKVEKANDEKNILAIRAQYNIKKDDFLIVTGGKIDTSKTQIMLLMKAIMQENIKAKMIIFGSVSKEMKKDFESLCDGEKIRFVGWLNVDDSYKYLASANLVVFPGRHSVFWEQVVGLGIPAVFRYWPGISHLDIGGNCKFLYSDSVEEIRQIIQELEEKSQSYLNMLESAKSVQRMVFFYSDIAKKSILQS